MKNYVCFINDHSGSMAGIAKQAAADYNANIEAIKNAATQEMLDTVVSTCSVDGSDTRLTVTVSNPHVLKPITNWRAGGGTPLWTGIFKMADMLSKLPDINNKDVSVLIMITTDGEDTEGSFALERLREFISPFMATGRWTLVARVPKNTRQPIIDQFTSLGIPTGNIQRWETTAAGMQASTAVQTAAVGNYFLSRSAGAQSTSSFYMDASKVDITALTDLTKELSLYVVPPEDNGIEIQKFILRHRQQYLKGAAFYQLTKTEARVGPDKQVLVRDRASGKIFGGAEARKMLNLPSHANQRVHPGDHKNFDIFIQSESTNRKLVGGTGVLYYAKIGVPFTQAELERFQPKPAAPVAVPQPVQLPAVPVSTKPTPSPIPVTKRPVQITFDTREEARRAAAAKGVPQKQIQRIPGPTRNSVRWSV